jgi:hypothetical protein
MMWLILLSKAFAYNIGSMFYSIKKPAREAGFFVLNSIGLLFILQHRYAFQFYAHLR